MTAGYAEFLTRRRVILELSQRELARRSGVKQPLIAAIESGARQPSAAARRALDDAVALRPSVALAACRDEVRTLFRTAGLPEPEVFGSVARGDDTTGSDLDLLVEFTEHHDIVDLLELEDALANLLTVRVDLVDDRTVGTVAEQARSEARAL
ncbi:nucleotidyltransferase domain-containing protein [Aeromicrobium sp. CF4.19]|uniref:nucleotidyltransferase domain-containing protein n=1 Tax=Aeromicrobium sp. CF4.19 TaxID=3373082 RepID=UPI003EE6AD61